MAQLYIKGKCYGVHAFVVEVRDPKTLKNTSGIETGMVGCMMGMTSANSGYMVMKNVRIPRESMLMKFSKVHKVSSGRFQGYPALVLNMYDYRMALMKRLPTINWSTLQ